MRATRLYTTIDSRVLRVCTFSVATDQVSVDDMALLASQSLGGPQVGISRSSKWTEHDGISWRHHSWYTYTVVVVACCPEEAIGTLYWLEEQFTAGFEFPEYGTDVYRLRGGELIADNLSCTPQPEWEFSYPSPLSVAR